MKRIKILVIIAIIAIIFASCTTAKFSGLQMAKSAQSYKKLGDFTTSVWVWEFLGSSGGVNLLNITADAMDGKVYDAIQKEITKLSGDAAINITIEQRSDLLDIVINSFTSAILAPVHVIITGTVVKY